MIGAEASRRSRAVCVIVCIVSGTLLAQPPLRLREHLRLDGTQLDLRGTSMSDDDLAQVDARDFDRVSAVLLAGTDAGDAGIAHLVRLPLRQLDLARTRVTDATLARLRGLPLERLDLTSTNVTDNGVMALSGLPLSVLTLRDTKVRGSGLVALTGADLKSLDLSRTQTADAALAGLEKTRRIDALDLSDTPLTDQAVPYLERIPGLRVVELAGTRIGPAGIGRLKQSRPGLTVTTSRPMR
jgi:hypothetical protein